MKKNLLGVLMHSFSYNYLCTSFVIIIFLYSFQRNCSIKPSIMAIIWLIAIMLLFIGELVLIYYLVREKSKKEYIEKMDLCRQCATDLSKYQFANFDFLTFDELMDIETSLKDDQHPEKCFIYVYTSDFSTEDCVESTVTENIKAGITYKIFYIDGSPSQQQRELYGSKNLIKCQASELDRIADFDIVIYVDSSNNIKGYFVVNFSIVKGPRPCSQGYVCKNDCHYMNENLLYKKIRDDTVELLLKSLRAKERNNEN